MKMQAFRTLCMLGVLAASAASAQVYTVQSQSQAYASLLGQPGVTTVSLTPKGSLSAPDEGWAIVPLGFTFPYYGQNYTTVHVDSNGFLLFGGATTCDVGFTTCTSGNGIPNATRSPHTVIAPWWQDDDGAGGGSILTKQSAGQIEIEFNNWSQFASSFRWSVKVTLTASGLFQVHYGTFTGSGSGSTVGWENQTGTSGGNYLNCSPTSSGCGSTFWPTNTLFTIGQPVQPDVVVAAVSIANLVVDGSNRITFNVTPTFQNYGQNAATPAFGWKAYLSTDKILDGADRLVATVAPSVTLTGAGTAGATAQATAAADSITAVPPGQYYVIVDADTTNVITEASETNNNGSTTNYFVNGLDLVATGVSGPAQSGPGNPVVVNAKWFNQGTTAAGTVSYRVLLSLDTVVSTNDFTLYSGSRTVSGGETIDENLSFNVPGNVPGGDFFYILQIDPSNAIVEASETNNAFTSSPAKVTMKQADLVNTGSDFIDPVTGASTRIGYLGQPAKVTVSLDNVGGANANNFKVAVVISTDSTLSLLSDTIAVEQSVVLVPQGATGTIVTIPFTLPTKDRNNVSFPSGNYYIFTILDSTSAVTELNEANNSLLIMGAVQLRAPAADLTVTRIEAAATGAVGEVIPILRTLKNIGNVDAPVVKYRYFASANATIDALNDVPLSIVTGSTTSLEGTVTLAVGAADTQTELVKLPPSMAPGAYYLGCVIDTAQAVAELDEFNNSLASSVVQVAPSSLKVSTQQLPDAVTDRPYSYRLTAVGEQGVPSTWTLDPSQGTLPAGMTLDTDGLIHGIPTTATVAAFTVVVSNGGRDANGRLVLRVLPTTTQVEVTTTSVPPVINTPAQKYDFSLGAAGGVKPYAWKVITGTLPQSLALSNDGILSGYPKLGLAEGTTKVTVEVTDSLGTKASRELVLRVVAPGSIVFKSLSLADGMVGDQYAQDIVVENADHTPIAKPLTWTKQGELPDGLALTPAAELISIEGTPLRAGSYSFTMTVEDAKGRADSAVFTILVYSARLKLAANGVPVAIHPGDTLSYAIVANTNANPKFAIKSGQLAPGLSMKPDGTITGTIALDNSEGNYNYVVEASDDTGATGLGAFNLEVKRVITPVGCGCNDVGFSSLWMLGMLIPAGLRRLRRR
jgi:hypothetical protein